MLEEVRGHLDGVDTATLAARTGLHANTVRFHLDVLAQAELITVAADPVRKPGRPRLLFFPARLPPPAPPGRPGQRPRPSGDGYELLAAVLIRHLGRSATDPGAAAEAAGRSWVQGSVAGDRLVPEPDGDSSDAEVVARVTSLLADLGFAPETVRDVTGWRILLHRCPFSALAAEQPEVVCRLHLGLLQGAVNRLGRPAEGVRLEPFVAPGLCEAFVPTSTVQIRPRD